MDAGFHFNFRDVVKNVDQLRLYLGVERVAGADQLVTAGLLDHEYAMVLRIEPALSTLQK